MSTLTLFIVSLMWSFVGILVKSASGMVSSWVITFCRFFFGVLFLAVFIYIKEKKLVIHWKNPWIWVGVFGKSFNYMLENLAVATGYSYGIILGMPLQALFVLMITALYFKEKIPLKNWMAVLLCIGGVFLVVWNGMSLRVLFNTSAFTTLLYVLSSIGVAFHLLSQKVLIKSMDSGSMNFSTFLFASCFTALPLPFSFTPTGNFAIIPVVALICLGLITGGSFYLYANALKKVPFLASVIITNSSVLFSLLWSSLFFHEPITGYIILGALLFLTGVIIINIPKGAVLFRKNQAAFTPDVKDV